MRIGSYDSIVHVYCNAEETAFLGITNLSGDVDYFVSIAGNWNNVVMITRSTQTEFENTKRGSGIFKIRIDSTNLRTVKIYANKFALGLEKNVKFGVTPFNCELQVQDNRKFLVIDPVASIATAQPVLTDIKQTDLLKENKQLITPSNVDSNVGKVEEQIAEIARTLVVPPKIERPITLRQAKDHSELKNHSIELNAILAKVPSLFVSFDKDNNLQLEREELQYEVL